MAKVAIVTGGSSGIGKAVAIKLNKSGCKVYEFSRNGSSENGIIHCSVDVTDEELVNKTVCEIFEKEKRIKRPAVSTAGKRNYQKTFFVSTRLDKYNYGVIEMEKSQKKRTNKLEKLQKTVGKVSI